MHYVDDFCIWSHHLCFLNLLNQKRGLYYSFVSLSLTALTLYAFYADSSRRVLQEDWSGLMDIMPTMSTALWGCTVALILINSISLFRKDR